MANVWSQPTYVDFGQFTIIDKTRDEMFVELQTHGVRPVLVKGETICETGVMSIVKL